MEFSITVALGDIVLSKPEIPVSKEGKKEGREKTIMDTFGSNHTVPRLQLALLPRSPMTSCSRALLLSVEPAPYGQCSWAVFGTLLSGPLALPPESLRFTDPYAPPPAIPGCTRRGAHSCGTDRPLSASESSRQVSPGSKLMFRTWWNSWCP